MYDFIKVFLKTNLFIQFSHLQTQQLKSYWWFIFSMFDPNHVLNVSFFRTDGVSVGFFFIKTWKNHFWMVIGLERDCASWLFWEENWGCAPCNSGHRTSSSRASRFPQTRTSAHRAGTRTWRLAHPVHPIYFLLDAVPCTIEPRHVRRSFHPCYWLLPTILVLCTIFLLA
jgi:hypothetical protein